MAIALNREKLFQIVLQGKKIVLNLHSFLQGPFV